MRYNREKKELTFDEAKDKALRLLEFRSHSERELSDKLKIAGAKEEDIDEILGIDTEYVEEAVSYLEEDEEDMLLPLVEKRLKGNFEKKNIDKCIRYFMYRGYGFSDIKNCIDNIKEEYGE